MSERAVYGPYMQGQDRLIDSVDDSKVCARCRAAKALKDFGPDRNAGDGRGKWCRECKREYKAVWRARNIDKVRREVYAASLRLRYEMTLPQYEARAQAQGRGLCRVWADRDRSEPRWNAASTPRRSRP
jgi:hypothetical protein